MHPSVGSSGLGTSCSPSPPKSVLSQSAPADVNAFTYLHGDIDAADGTGNTQVNTALLYLTAAQCVKSLHLRCTTTLIINYQQKKTLYNNMKV